MTKSKGKASAHRQQTIDMLQEGIHNVSSNVEKLMSKFDDANDAMKESSASVSAAVNALV